MGLGVLRLKDLGFCLSRASGLQPSNLGALLAIDFGLLLAIVAEEASTEPGFATPTVYHGEDQDEAPHVHTLHILRMHNDPTRSIPGTLEPTTQGK